INIHVRAEEYQGEVVFLHKIHPGPADKSYGIHVAKLAELPDLLIDRARVILSELEKDKTADEKPELISEENGQLSLFEHDQAQKQERESKIEQQLRSLNLMELTPMEAMNELYRLQLQAKKEG